MTEIKQTLFGTNHKLRVNLPKEFNYKQVNLIVTPCELKIDFHSRIPISCQLI